MTTTSVGGPYWGLGDRGFAPFQGGTNVFMVADSLDMIRGKHNIRVGGQIRAQQMNVLTNAFQDGFFVFSNFWTNNGPTFQGGDNAADFLLGLNSLAIHDQTFKGATTGRRWKLFRPYVQDDWRVTPNLTVNLGLAWAFVTPITEAHDRQANFDFNSTCGSPPGCNYLIPGANSDGRVGIELDKTALEPRIGLAWKPFGSAKTAVRAGYAMFHDSSWNQGAQGLWENPPFFAESGQFAFTVGGCAAPTAACAASVGPFDFGLNVSNGFPIFTQQPDPATFAGTIQSQNLNFKQGRVQQFNFNVEQELPGSVVMTVGYAGSRSHHILVDGSNLNVSSPTHASPLFPTRRTPAVRFPTRFSIPTTTWAAEFPPLLLAHSPPSPISTTGVTLATILSRSRPKPKTFGTDSTSSWVTPTRATSTTDSTMAWVRAQA